MSKCEKCIHKPICEWVESNFKEFSLCKDEESPCLLFYEEKETNCTDFDHTIEMMLSSDYRERFKAEYYQTKIRYEKLKAFCNRIEAAHIMNARREQATVVMPKHDVPYDILREQQKIMGEYLHTLEIRAVIEDIRL